METQVGRLSYRLPNDLAQRVQASLADWQTQGKVRRLWAKDSSLWTGTDEGKWLGWLDVVREQFAQCDMYEQFAREVQQAGFRDVLLLGMGGSSLCPEVLTLSFGKQAGFPTLAAAVERALQ